MISAPDLLHSISVGRSGLMLGLSRIERYYEKRANDSVLNRYLNKIGVFSGQRAKSVYRRQNDFFTAHDDESFLILGIPEICFTNQMKSIDLLVRMDIFYNELKDDPGIRIDYLENRVLRVSAKSDTLLLGALIVWCQIQDRGVNWNDRGKSRWLPQYSPFMVARSVFGYDTDTFMNSAPVNFSFASDDPDDLSLNVYTANGKVMFDDSDVLPNYADRSISRIHVDNPKLTSEERNLIKHKLPKGLVGDEKRLIAYPGTPGWTKKALTVECLMLLCLVRIRSVDRTTPSIVLVGKNHAETYLAKGLFRPHDGDAYRKFDDPSSDKHWNKENVWKCATGDPEERAYTLRDSNKYDSRWSERWWIDPYATLRDSTDSE